MFSLFISIMNLILIVMLALKTAKLEDENAKLTFIKRRAIDYIRSSQDENLSDGEILEKYLGIKVNV